MGFGTLLIGYLFFFNLVQGAYTDVFGALFLLYALAHLREYERQFRTAFALSVPYAAAAFAAFACKTLSLVGLFTVPVWLDTWLNVGCTVLRAGVILFALGGALRIGAETEVQHVAVRAFRNRIFTAVFYALWIALEVMQGIETDAQMTSVLGGISIGLLILGFVVHFLNAKLFFSCYIWICLEGDEEMARTETRNPIVKLINRVTDRVEDRMVETRKREAEEKAEHDRRYQHKQQKKDRRP